MEANRFRWSFPTDFIVSYQFVVPRTFKPQTRHVLHRAGLLTSISCCSMITVTSDVKALTEELCEKSPLSPLD
jgi:hypothetical protein